MTRRRAWRPPDRGERGTALIEVTWLSLLLLVPLVYVVVAAFDVQRTAYALDAATRAAGRAYTLADSEGEGTAHARIAAEVALADQGLRLSDGSFHVSCEPAPHDCLAPGASVHVSMSYRVVLPLVPDALGGGAPSIRVSTAHDVPYGTFREDRP